MEYTLHPSFPDPVRTVLDREHRFAIMSNGWGSFLMEIRVIYEDGHEEFTSHMVGLPNAFDEIVDTVPGTVSNQFLNFFPDIGVCAPITGVRTGSENGAGFFAKRVRRKTKINRGL